MLMTVLPLDPAVAGPTASISPSLPQPGSVYGYTPSYMEIDLYGYLVSTTEGIVVTVDGRQLTRLMSMNDTIRAYIDFWLDYGTHHVAASVPGTEGSHTTEWDFLIDSSSEDAIRPQITPVYPTSGSTQSRPPEYVSAWINISVPGMQAYNANMMIDGQPLPATIYPETDQLTMVHLSSVPPVGLGEHIVSVELLMGEYTWNMWSWTFNITTQPTPALYLSIPQPGSTVAGTPEYIEAYVDLGSTDTMYRGTLYFHGISLPTLFIAPNKLRADLPYVYPDGSYIINATADTSTGFIHSGWSISITSPGPGVPTGVELSPLWYRDDYALFLPLPWTITEDDEVAGTDINISAVGPVHGGFATNVLVQDLIDPTIMEEPVVLMSHYSETVGWFEQNNISYIVHQAPQLIILSGHSGMVFAIRWTSGSESFIQKFALVVDETSHRYWAFTCTSISDAYGLYDACFDRIIESLDTTPGAEVSGVSLTMHEYQERYQLLVPINWTLQEDHMLFGRPIDIIVTGPVVSGVATNLNLQSGNDPTFGNTEEEIYRVINQTMIGLHAGDATIAMYEVPTMLFGDDRTMAIYSLTWGSLNLVQKQVLLFNVTSHD